MEVLPKTSQIEEFIEEKSVVLYSCKSIFHPQLGALSVTHSHPIQKLDIPTFDWPQAEFPTLKYPLHEHQRENEAEEERCLARVSLKRNSLKVTSHFPERFSPKSYAQLFIFKVEEIFYEERKKRPIAAAIIEPIQAEGGDRHASPDFFNKLRNIVAKVS
jgi:4-aminobutyrate aminotransferase/(S)-3-amino-2-methylpropionate transaminase